MEISGTAKTPNLTFRYNANNEELEELFDICEEDPPTAQVEASSSAKNENASPKKSEKSPSILDKYFKSTRSDKFVDKLEDVKGKDVESKSSDEGRTPPKDVTVSPVKEYLNRFSKKSASEAEAKEGGNETWKIFHDFKFKITQAVEDIKTRSGDDTKEKEKSVPRESSVSDSEENSVVKDLDTSVGDTDNQVSSLDSSIQNLSDISQPLTAKATEQEKSFRDSSRHNSESSDDTHRNLVHSYAADVTGQYLTDSNPLEVESGVEALEDNVDAFGDLAGLNPSNPNDGHRTPPTPTSSPRKCANFGIPPNDKHVKKSVSELKRKSYFLTFTMYFLTILLVVTFIFFPNWNVWNGFLLGIWFFYIISNIKQYIMDTYFGDWEPYQQTYAQLDRSSHFPVYTIPSVQEHKPIKKYEGWINHYRAAEYDPYSYHINQTTTAYMKLEGVNLRISYTKTKIAKRAIWNEDIEKVVFYQHRLYNLTGARVILLPRGLVKRRHWSKKYPICIILQDNEKIQVLEKESVGTERRMSESLSEKRRESNDTEAETNTPEKKKRFVWRKKEKSVSNSECETSNKDKCETSNKDKCETSNKEGLRQRLVRRMHRDKKPDSVSAGTDVPDASPKDRAPPDDTFHDAEAELPPRTSLSTHREEDDEIDETEMSKIREFLEETELEMGDTAEGEWSLHVKYSDNHSRIYLFARTGRDKHEWYRRLNNAVLEGMTPSDSMDTDEPAPEHMRDAIELAVYKLSERENVAFRPERSERDVNYERSFPGLHHESIQEGVTFGTERTYAQERDVESLFWPYILKVIQTHEITAKTTSEAAVMCEIEPSSLNRSKSKKKKKDTKPSLNTCECRILPLEVTWVNTMVARVMYDIMRDPHMNARLHTRIQKKLHTLKLPSFMSPLVVTQLSLIGACPMVERVSPPTWDERGVWLDADLRYDGGAYITILTQINLLKLKEKNVTLEEQLLAATGANMSMDFESHPSFSEHSPLQKRKIAACDSEMEDSAESSDDNESPPLQPVDSFEKLPGAEPRLTQEAPGSSKKKFLRMVDKIATNKYFQQVTDYKYVKRAMEGLSNTDIKLQIEVHGLEGRLALNLPPPPHDRVWVGFRTNPQLILKARPAVGQRALRFAHISNWIEEKLTKEFEKVMVLPNMEDIMIDVMTPTPIQFE